MGPGIRILAKCLSWKPSDTTTASCSRQREQWSGYMPMGSKSFTARSPTVSRSLFEHRTLHATVVFRLIIDSMVRFLFEVAQIWLEFAFCLIFILGTRGRRQAQARVGAFF